MNRDLHQVRLMERAPSLGVAVEDLSERLELDLVRYSLGDQVELVRSGRVFSHLDAVAQRLCDDKHATKAMLREAGVPVPRGLRFTDPEDPRVAGLLAEGGRWVCKPLDGTHGEGVRMGVSGLGALRRACEEGPQGVWILEEEIPGRDLRLQAVGAKLVAACRREPPSVVGDGVRTLEELIAREAERVRAGNPANVLRVDPELLGSLSAASVLEAGRRIELGSTPNMASGGRAVDLTEAIHPDWGRVVERIGQSLRLQVFAVDAVTPDPACSPWEQGAVIEVNARAEWLHHTISEGRRHDLPGLLLAHLFGLPAPSPASTLQEKRLAGPQPRLRS